MDEITNHFLNTFVAYQYRKKGALEPDEVNPNSGKYQKDNGNKVLNIIKSIKE